MLFLPFPAAEEPLKLHRSLSYSETRKSLAEGTQFFRAGLLGEANHLLIKSLLSGTTWAVRMIRPRNPSQVVLYVQRGSPEGSKAETQLGELGAIPPEPSGPGDACEQFPIKTGSIK